MGEAFTMRDGALHAEDVPLDALADAVGTPFYLYSASAIAARYRAFAGAVPAGTLIAYSAKANPNLAVVATLAALGSGADVVSGGELARAVAAGIAPGRIVFSGVGKTREEMRAGLAAGIAQFNVESEPELMMLSEEAVRLGVTAPVAIRVNPDVSAGSHTKISTGRREDKFGIPAARVPAAAELARSLPGVELKGLAVHIGSQLTTLEPLEAAFAELGRLIAALRAAGHAVATADLGGGLGVLYAAGDAPPPGLAQYGELIACATRGWDVQLILEPGRAIVAEAGVLVATVILVKEGVDRRFVVVDAAMNDLLRPSLYGAHHAIVAVRPREGVLVADVVGPACESGDTFAVARELTPVEPGDRVALMTAGAYGATMASTYNSRPLVPEVMVRGNDWGIVSRRVVVDDMIALDDLAPWQR